MNAPYRHEAQDLVSQVSEIGKQTELATLRALMFGLACRVYELHGADPKRIKRVQILED